MFAPTTPRILRATALMGAAYVLAPTHAVADEEPTPGWCVPEVSGEAYVANHIAYAVDKLHRPHRLTGKGRTLETAAGKMFLAVLYTSTVQSKKPLLHSHEVLRLVDAGRREYAVEREPTLVYTFDRNMDAIPHELEPGVSYPQAAVFELPVMVLREGPLSLEITDGQGKHAKTLRVPLSCVPTKS